MARDYAHTDRISDLPNNVIDNIMQFLTLLDAARTSVLSKKWRSNWVSVPQLLFDETFLDDDIFDDFDAYKWSSIISSILFNHEGPINKFTVTIPRLLQPPFPDVIPWISFVSRNGVKNLEVENYGDLPISLPPHLFSGVGLKNLAPQGCIVGSLPYCMGFRNLLSLRLEGIRLEACVFTNFMACSPLLESLQLISCTIYVPPIINEESTINNSQRYGPLNINLPNLKNLVIDGNFESINFKNTPCLVEFTLNFAEVKIIEGAVDMIKFLARSCKLQRLFLEGSALEVLANSGISRILPTTFKQIKVLDLMNVYTDHVDGFLCVLDVVRSCRNMEKLLISLVQSFVTEQLKICVYDEDEMDALELKYFYNDGDCRFNHLRMINIDNTSLYCHLELKLISHLLAFSPSLEKLSFSCDHQLNVAQQLQLCRQMQQFQRASPRAQVVNQKG